MVITKIMFVVVIALPFCLHAQTDAGKLTPEQQASKLKRNYEVIDSVQARISAEKDVRKKDVLFCDFFNSAAGQEKFFAVYRDGILKDLAVGYAANNDTTASDARIGMIRNDRTREEAVRLSAAAYATAGNVERGLRMLRPKLDAFFLPDGTLKTENFFNYDYAVKVLVSILPEGSEVEVIHYLRPYYQFSGGFFPSDVWERLAKPDLEPRKQLFYRYAEALRKESPKEIAAVVAKAFEIGAVPKPMRPAVIKDFSDVSGFERQFDAVSAAGRAGFNRNVSALLSKPDMNGKVWGAQGLKEKYMLIDFWGSWCLPCRFGHPHLKELYAKYKDRGFEIVGIAKEAPAAPEVIQQKWRKAVAEDKIEWIHLLNNENESTFDAVKAFGIGSFPTKILLDKNGNEIGRYGGKPDELDAKLKEIFGF
ncbi:TlpA family protein disulfide reductase [Pedobacter faecalis]|uniref:TlpA family protein disulfide reductase n=1 Tax=Pedobacter faecalis TaxID=3041495 RepID=UPI00254D351C|nr:TlpA disulfide reductase family protein [Pedobacter sp. ELA7]